MKNERGIATLFLDIGGVLMTNGWDTASRELAAQTFQYDFKEMESRHRITFDTFEIGKVSLEEYLNRVLFYKPRHFTKQEYLKFMYAQSKPFPEMLQLFGKLKTKYNLKTVMVSNEGRELILHRIREHKLDQLIDFFVASAFVHLRKPDEEIYRLALDLSQARPDQVVYIDDREMFVDVAKSLGIMGIHHTDYASTCAKLAAFGLT